MAMSATDIERYRGQWIATDQFDETVIAVASSHAALLRELQRHSDRKVVIQRVPAADETFFVGLG